MIEYENNEATPGVNMEQTAWLRQPFTAAAIKFRAASKPSANGNVRCLTYIDARLAAARLSEVDDRWAFEHAPFVFQPCQRDFKHDDTKVIVYGYLTVGGVARSDVGDAWLSDGEWAKSAISDALKRCAVQFGVGQYLYALGACFVNDKGYRLSRGGTPILNNVGNAQLRDWYTKAITAEEFVKVYGQAIDYGDRVAPDEADVAAEPDPEPPKKSAAKKRAPAKKKAAEEFISNEEAQGPAEPEPAGLPVDTLEPWKRAAVIIGTLGGAAEEYMVEWVADKTHSELVLRNTAKAALKQGAEREAITAVLVEYGQPDDILAALFDAEPVG